MTILTRLDELKRIADAATLGDWYFDQRGVNWLMSPVKTVLSASHDGNYASNVAIQKADAEFITTSRTALPQLVEALREAVATLNFKPNSYHPDKCLTRIAELLEIKP